LKKSESVKTSFREAVLKYYPNAKCRRISSARLFGVWLEPDRPGAPAGIAVSGSRAWLLAFLAMDKPAAPVKEQDRQTEDI
jgi:hypothetical protein